MEKYFTEIYEKNGKFYATASDGNPIEMDFESREDPKNGVHDSIRAMKPQMKRDQNRAGTTIYCHGYELRYNENGYCGARIKMN